MSRLNKQLLFGWIAVTVSIAPTCIWTTWGT